MYTQEEKEEYNQNINDLSTMWKLFIHEKINGTDTNHAPPAIISTCELLIEYNLTEDAVEIGKFVDICSQMFLFGQFTAKNGLLAANMLECKCEKVNDEELAKLFDK